MEWPDTRAMLNELLDGHEFAGKTVTTYFRLTADYLDKVSDSPAVLLYPVGGTVGAVDRVDRVGVDVYGVGTKGREVAEAILAFLCPTPWYPNRHETTLGYIDDVQPEVTPVDVPFADPQVTQSQAVVRVTVRPV